MATGRSELLLGIRRSRLGLIGSFEPSRRNGCGRQPATGIPSRSHLRAWTLQKRTRAPTSRLPVRRVRATRVRGAALRGRRAWCGTPRPWSACGAGSEAPGRPKAAAFTQNAVPLVQGGTQGDPGSDRTSNTLPESGSSPAVSSRRLRSGAASRRCGWTPHLLPLPARPS